MRKTERGSFVKHRVTFKIFPVESKAYSPNRKKILCIFVIRKKTYLFSKVGLLCATKKIGLQKKLLVHASSL